MRSFATHSFVTDSGTDVLDAAAFLPLALVGPAAAPAAAPPPAAVAVFASFGPLGDWGGVCVGGLVRERWGGQGRLAVRECNSAAHVATRMTYFGR